LDDGADQPLGLPQRQVKHGPERQRRQDRQRGILALPAWGGTRLSRPSRDRLVGEPHGQAAALAQAGVILTPVRDLVLLFGDMVAAVLVQLKRQDGCPRSDQRASYAGPVPGATGGSMQQGRVSAHFFRILLIRSNRRGTDPYARWCGRGGAVRRPPISIIPGCITFDSTAGTARIGQSRAKNRGYQRNLSIIF